MRESLLMFRTQVEVLVKHYLCIPIENQDIEYKAETHAIVEPTEEIKFETNIAKFKYYNFDLTIEHYLDTLTDLAYFLSDKDGHMVLASTTLEELIRALKNDGDMCYILKEKFNESYKKRNPYQFIKSSEVIEREEKREMESERRINN